MACFREHCAFGFWKESLVLGSDGVTSEGGMGHFGRIRAISDLPPPETLVGYVQEAMRLNEDGVKVPKKAAPRCGAEAEVPEAFRAALERHPQAAEVLERFSPSQRGEYVEWIADARREETRDRRIGTAVEWIAEGKPRHWKYIRS